MKAHYTTVLFDWDGTLIDSLPAWLEAFQDVFAAYGLSVDEKTVVKNLFGNWSGLNATGISDTAEFQKKLFPEITQKMMAAPLFPEAEQVLQTLKDKNIKTAVLANTPSSVVRKVLEVKQLHKTIDLLLSINEVPRSKPDPAIVFEALARLKSKPQESIVIGDSDKDMMMAHHAQVSSALFYPPESQRFYDKNELTKCNPTYVISSLREIVDIALR